MLRFPHSHRKVAVYRDHAGMNLEALFLGNRRTISGTVYGTIVVLAAITGSAKAVDPNLWSVAVIAAVTSGVLWVAHVYSHGLGESVTIGRRLTAAELAALARREAAILRAAVLPVFVVVLGALGLFHARTALWLAVGSRRRDAHDPGDSLRTARGPEHRGHDRQRRHQPRARPVDRDRQGSPHPLAARPNHPGRTVSFRVRAR